MGKNGFYSLNEGMEKLRKGFFAYEVELSSAYNYIMEKFTIDEMCCIQEIDGHFNVRSTFAKITQIFGINS